MEIKGLKEAVEQYRRINACGRYSPRYGHIRLNRITGEMWTDEYYSFGRGSDTHYPDQAIITISNCPNFENLTMQGIEELAEKLCLQYLSENQVSQTLMIIPK